MKNFVNNVTMLVKFYVEYILFDLRYYRSTTKTNRVLRSACFFVAKTAAIFIA